ncbi:MAG: indole-3-glycerol phosphate synthase TrpC [Atopobiaceae bacterium]
MTEARENVLARIADATRDRVRRQEEADPLEAVRGRALAAAAEQRQTGDFTFPFERALAADGMSFICEIKRASPSKGLIAPDFPYLQIASDYERAGAAAISCLTEPTWFKGSDEILRQVAAHVDIPVLRKDFVVDEYMIYQAKLCGAAAVLLICSILDEGQLARYVDLCHQLGMSALVEAYQPEEVPMALRAGARVVGVNNRDLRTFEVDFGRSIDLRPLVGPDRLFVSESGVRTAEDVRRLADAGVDAVLVGETLMRAPNKRTALDELRRLL